jgi:hypothetical protein
MSDGKRKPTDVEIFLPKPKPDRKLYHVTVVYNITYVMMK